MERITTSEFYNKLIETTKTTGQGLPMWVVDRMGAKNIVDFLEVQGFIQKINGEKDRSAFRANDTWVCLTNIYCVEADNLSNSKDLFGNLSFIRRWLNLDQTEDVPFTLMQDSNGDKNGKQAYENWLVDSRDDYAQWIVKNLEGLEAISNLKAVTDSDLIGYGESSIKPGTEIYELLTSRGWFKDNLAVMECIDRCDKISLFEERISINTQLIKLYHQSTPDGGDKERVTESKESILEDKREIKMREAFLSVMKGCPDDEIGVQEAFGIIL